MKTNLTFKSRKHISQENYNMITKIRNTYGEVQFRMAISHLFSKGYEFFDDLTEDIIEEQYLLLVEQEKQDEENGKISMMTPEFVKELNLCALELSKIDHILLLKFITNYLYYDIK